jgi:PAS domain S-box-containing protein
MQPEARTIRFWGVNRYVPLRYRFITVSSVLLAVLLACIIMLVSRQQGMIMREQAELRGLAIAQSLAATSKQDLITYNYVALSQSANQAAQGSDLVYIIIHDKEGRVAASSGRPELQGKFLEDPIAQKACASKVPLVQATHLEPLRLPTLDVAVPVDIPGSTRSWGVVRVGLSLVAMQRQIWRLQIAIAGMGLIAWCCAIVAYSWLVRRITRPIARLVDATIVAAKGDLNHEIRISTGDEVEVLAANFSAMIREVFTQRQQLEQQLLEITGLQRYLDKLVTTMNDGLMTIDLEGSLITVNPAAQQLLGLSATDLCEPRKVEGVFQGMPEVLRYLQALLRRPNSVQQRELRIGQGLDSKSLIVASSLLHDNRGWPQQVIVNIHDITDLKKLESRIRQTERLAELGTLAAGMAHEIRNPLSAIKTFVQLLPRKWDKKGFQEKFLCTVPRELERINRLIGDLLELARAPRYQFGWLDMRTFLRQSLDLFEEELLHHRVVCRLELEEDLPPVWADSDQLSKAVNNLIQNAIQAMPDGGHLTIKGTIGAIPVHRQNSESHNGTDNPRRWLRVVLTDTGPGVLPSDVKMIFHPFFTTKDAGTGLGLAITHKVISEHGGQIDVESDLGVGTRFMISLPVIDPCREGVGEAVSQPAQNHV